jgi:hypothetical protein
VDWVVANAEALERTANAAAMASFAEELIMLDAFEKSGRFTRATASALIARLLAGAYFPAPCRNGLVGDVVVK